MIWTLEKKLALVRTVREMDKERQSTGKATRSWLEIARRLPIKVFGKVDTKLLAKISKDRFFSLRLSYPDLKTKWAIQRSRSPHPDRSILDQLYQELDELYFETHGRHDYQTNSYLSGNSFPKSQDRKTGTSSKHDLRNEEKFSELDDHVHKRLDKTRAKTVPLSEHQNGIEELESSLQERVQPQKRVSSFQARYVKRESKSKSSEKLKRKRGSCARDEDEFKGDFRDEERNDLNEPRSLKRQCDSPSGSEWQGSQPQDADRQTDWKLRTLIMFDSEFDRFSSWINHQLISAGREKVYHGLSAEKAFKKRTLSKYGEFTQRSAHSRTSSAVRAHFKDLRLRITEELDKTMDHVIGETVNFFRNY